MLINGAFINLDGHPLTALKFIRPYTHAQRSFAEFFEVLTGDEGFRSLRVTQFNVTASNRDFDFNTIPDYKNRDEHQIWKEGLVADIQVEFADDCDLPLCALYRASHQINAPIRLTGRVGPEKTELVGRVLPFDLEGKMSLENVTLGITVTQGQTVNVTMGGELYLIAESDHGLSLTS